MAKPEKNVSYKQSNHLRIQEQNKRKERSLNMIHQFSMESINPKYPNQKDELGILKCSDTFDESRLISSRLDLLFVYS